jgi:hypothetical protein
MADNQFDASEPAVTLGGIGLFGMEVPATMPWGGQQRLVVHELIGGGRVVDVMGAVPDDISWSGSFTGPDAVDRALAIDDLRQAGAQIQLLWATFSYDVVIKSFSADYGNAGVLIPYKIACVVIPPAQQTSDAQTPVGSAGSDLSSAAAAPGLPPSVQDAVTSAQDAMPDDQDIAPADPVYAAFQGQVDAAATAADAAQSAADAQLDALGASAAGSGLVFGGSDGLLAATNAQGDLSSSAQAAAFTGRASTNLAQP